MVVPGGHTSPPPPVGPRTRSVAQIFPVVRASTSNRGPDGDGEWRRSMTGRLAARRRCGYRIIRVRASCPILPRAGSKSPAQMLWKLPCSPSASDRARRRKAGVASPIAERQIGMMSSCSLPWASTMASLLASCVEPRSRRSAALALFLRVTRSAASGPSAARGSRDASYHDTTVSA